MSRINETALVDELVALVAQGNHIKVACAAAGVSSDRFYHWLKTGAALDQRIDDDARDALVRGDVPDGISDHEAKCWWFRSRILVARARGEQYAARIVTDASKRDWIAAMTYLDRRHPQRWSRRHTLGEANPMDLPTNQRDLSVPDDIAKLLVPGDYDTPQ